MNDKDEKEMKEEEEENERKEGQKKNEPPLKFHTRFIAGMQAKIFMQINQFQTWSRRGGL